MYFVNYGLRKMLLDKCLKSRVSKDRSTSNLINGIKQCWNLKNPTFNIFIDHCEEK